MYLIDLFGSSGGGPEESETDSVARDLYLLAKGWAIKSDEVSFRFFFGFEYPCNSISVEDVASILVGATIVVVTYKVLRYRGKFMILSSPKDSES